MDRDLRWIFRYWHRDHGFSRCLLPTVVYVYLTTLHPSVVNVRRGFGIIPMLVQHLPELIEAGCLPLPLLKGLGYTILDAYSISVHWTLGQTPPKSIRELNFYDLLDLVQDEENHRLVKREGILSVEIESATLMWSPQVDVVQVLRISRSPMRVHFLPSQPIASIERLKLYNDWKLDTHLIVGFSVQECDILLTSAFLRQEIVSTLLAPSTADMLGLRGS